MNDPMQDVVEKLMTQKNEIIDLFCKTFILSKEPKSIGEIKFIFENYVLEIKHLGKEYEMGWQYQLVRKDK